MLLMNTYREWTLIEYVYEIYMYMYFSVRLITHTHIRKNDQYYYLHAGALKFKGTWMFYVYVYLSKKIVHGLSTFHWLNYFYETSFTYNRQW